MNEKNIWLLKDVSIDELGFFIYKQLGGYTDNSEEAIENWTGKHYQSKLKKESYLLAIVLHGKFIIKEKNDEKN